MTANIQLGEYFKAAVSEVFKPYLTNEYFDSADWAEHCKPFQPLDESFMHEYIEIDEHGGIHDHTPDDLYDWMHEKSPIDSIAKMLERLRFPSNPTYHQKPSAGRYLFPLIYNSDADLVQINRILFILWLRVWCYLIDYYHFAGLQSYELSRSVLKDLHALSEKIVKKFGSYNENICSSRKDGFPGLEDKYIWFICAHGCFDLESDTPINPDLATLREFEAKSKISNL